MTLFVYMGFSEFGNVVFWDKLEEWDGHELQ